MTPQDTLDRAQKLLTAGGGSARWACLFDSEQAVIIIYELAEALRAALAENEQLPKGELVTFIRLNEHRRRGETTPLTINVNAISAISKPPGEQQTLITMICEDHFYVAESYEDVVAMVTGNRRGSAK